jgi:glycosyltransferase involved in cell wall biosynthesis
MSLRITFVLPHLSLSGGDKITFTYADGLAARGHDVTVVHGRLPSLKARMRHSLFGRNSEFHLPGDKVKLVPAKGPPGALPRFLPDADILVGSWWETVESISKAPAAKGRMVHHVQGHEVFSYLPARAASVYRLPNAKIVVSNWLRDIMQTTYGAKNVSLVLNPVDTRKFVMEARPPAQAPTVGTVYSSAPMKNSASAFTAAARAREKVPGLRLLAFGAGELARGLEGMSHVDFHLRPDQDLIPELYRACDYWLFSSTSEGFGLPILEAMASGTPVIATPAGAAPDLVNEETGMLLAGYEPREMADAIVNLYSAGEAKRREMARACRATAEAHDIASAVSQFETILLAQIQ